MKYTVEQMREYGKVHKNQKITTKTAGVLELLKINKSPINSLVPTGGMKNVCFKVGTEENKNSSEGDADANIVTDLELCEARFESVSGVGCLGKAEGLNGCEKTIECANSEATSSIEEIINVNENLTAEEITAMKSVVIKYCSGMKGKKQRKLSGYSMKINLKSSVPVFSSPRRLSYNEKIEVKETIDELLEQGIIQPSESPYASPVVLVRKKNGKRRMCVDYRELNKLTVRDHFPLPLIDDCLEYLGGKKFFSAIDLKNGFHQVPMHEESIPLTAFVTPMGQYEYLYMPFGLTNAPSVFQRFIYLTLRPLIDRGKIVVYLDDINVATKTLEEHLDLLTEVLKLLADAGLQLNFSKCKFGYQELEYLGYCVSEQGIRPSEEHLRAISDYPVPTSTKEVQRAVGLFSYFRRFVHNFSRIARPLNKLLQKDAKFCWTDDCASAFETLRDSLTRPPILRIFDPSRETELHTDASAQGYGAVLLQKQDNNRFYPVAFYSKTTTDAESRYHSFELETLAIVNALERLRTFVDGIPFVIVTDGNSLVLTLQKKLINPRIARWTLGLANFNFTVRHRKGEQMQHVDALSRSPVVCLVGETEVDLNIQIEQTRDTSIRELRDRLERASVPGYELENGLVFRVSEGHSQLFVPKEMEDNVIRQVHETYGHLGIDKCSNQIKKHYWFPSMRDKVGRFIRNCLKCIFYSTSPRSNERNLYNIPKKAEPFDTLHVDHFGPLEGVNSKHRHILVVVDAFTKFVKLYAVNTGSKETICALEKYFMNYSRPKRLVSDRGTCFTSMEFKNFCSERNVKHILNAVASPQSNGQVERVNRVLKAVLAKITEPISHADWKDKLTQVEYALNNTVHCATKQTPSELLFGVEQRGEIVDELTEYLHEAYSKERRNLIEVRQEADQCIQKSQSRNQKYFEQTHKPAREFRVGDLVVIKNVDTTIGKNKKLIPKYKGPYVISKQLDHDRYVVTDVENCQLTQMPYNCVIDSTRLRKWLEPEEQLYTEDIEGDTEDHLDDKITDDECTDYEFLLDDS